MKRILTFLLAVTMLFTMFPASVMAANADVGVADDKLVTGTISFPDDAYLEGGSLLVDVWTMGRDTGEYLKNEYKIDSLEDVDFEFWFPANETAVSTRVMLRNLTGAKTNLYTETSSNLDFTLTEDGSMVDTYDFHYIDIDRLADMDVVMPCGKTVSGKINGINLQFVEDANLTLCFDHFYWTRAFIDPETHEYTAVMPYDIPEGSYRPYVETSMENATSNILVDTMYHADNYVDVNHSEDITNLNFTVRTGYAISGEVILPEDAVLENYDITSQILFNNEIYHVTGLITRAPFSENRRSVPFMFAVDKGSPVTSVFELYAYGNTADDMLMPSSYSNVVVNASYYYDGNKSSLDANDAKLITIDSDVDDIVFELQTGNVYNFEMTAPESVAGQYIWYTLYAVSSDGGFVKSVQDRVMPDKSVSCAQLVVPKMYDEVHLMYKIDYDAYGEYPSLYTGKAYINADGSITGLRSEADTYSTDEEITVEFELAEFEDVEIPETVVSSYGEAYESAHPYGSNQTVSLTHHYSGSEDISGFNVTFSPLSWLYGRYADFSISDANGTTVSYKQDDFNANVSGETIFIEGSKFQIDFCTDSRAEYYKDYGFAITDIQPVIAGQEEKSEYTFVVYDASIASANVVPVAGAEVTITDGKTFSYKRISDANGKLKVSLADGEYTVEASKEGYNVYSAMVDVSDESKTIYIPLEPKVVNKRVDFKVVDKATRNPVCMFNYEIQDAETAEFVVKCYATTDDGTFVEQLENGKYIVKVASKGYKTKTETIEVTNEEREFVIELEKEEVTGKDVVIYVKDGDVEGTPAISDATVIIEDKDGKKVVVETDSRGKATVKLDDGTYNTTVIAENYQTRNFKLDVLDLNLDFTCYLNKDDIIDVDSTVRELTRDEMIDAGIDPDAEGNRHVYNCSAVLSFMPDVKISYNYTEDGAVIDPPTFVSGNITVTPVARDVYLVVKSSVSWLKETFEVQLIFTNTSVVETVENFVANLNLPEGLSFAIMTNGEQSSQAVMGEIKPKETLSHKWYVCGDEEGEYNLNGNLTGTRTGGGISEDININFGVKDSINVLAGSAMSLNIEAPTGAIAGRPYRMRYTLTNVSEKTIYDLAFDMLGGKFFDDYGVTEAKYTKEYGPEGIENLDGKGFSFKTEEFKPGDKVSGVFEIIFGEGLDLSLGEGYILKESFVVAGKGSTTSIPTTITWVDDIAEHTWDNGEVTKNANCTEDGVITYRCTDVGCDAYYEDKIPATGHKMGSFATVEPTCTLEGSKVSRCENEGCDHSVELVIPALGHNWEVEFTIDKDPTCTEKGSKSIHCTRCDDKKDVTEIPENGHAMSTWVETAAPNCTDDGAKRRDCDNCDYFETGVITALGHNWEVEFTIDKDPTCTEKGSKSIHCTRCDDKKDVTEIPENGHTMSTWSETVAPTCTTDGEKRRDCDNCDYYETEPIPTSGHKWDEGTITKQPTEDSEGEKTHTCTECGDKKTETLPKLVKQQIMFPVSKDITVVYGERKYVENKAMNFTEGGSTLSYSSSNTEVATVDENGRATIVGVGETVITATAAATEGYAESSASYKLIVTPASLTITAANVEIFYGETPELKDFNATGFVYDEDASVLGGEAVYVTNYKQFDKVGTYEITVSGLTAKNYNITFEKGTLTVKKAVDYTIEIGNLTQRADKTEAVTTSITPKDETAVIKVEYKIADEWKEEVPTEIGEYNVRASLVSADNITPKDGYYGEAVLTVKAGAMIDLDGNTSIQIDTVVDGENAEFKMSDEDVSKIIDNVPSSGEVVIDAKGSTEGVKELTLPSNIIDALNESDDVNSFTVLADDAEITMGTDVLATVADKVTETDKVSIRIDAVEKDELNESQQKALDSVGGGDDMIILQLNLVVTSYENGEPVNEQVHQLNGEVNVRAAYELPDDMIGKWIYVCYVADDGSMNFAFAKYDDGFVNFTTTHFSHFVIMAIPCPHQWDNGVVVTPATTSSTGVKRYTCELCKETKDETIPKKPSGGSGGGGGGGGAVPATYTVKFETNGGSEVKAVEVNKNKTLEKPATPVKDGFEFKGWYTDEKLSNEYNFDTKVTKNFTLYAKWAEVEKKPEEEKPEVEISFNDVKETDWFFSNVKFVVENKLMNGVSADKFAPNDTLTRAMLVTVLYRNAGEPAVNRSIPFADVDMGSYYANAVLWAKQNGIVNGINETEFAPDANITREQIAAIMMRYAIYKGNDALTLEENLHFADNNEISEYAISAMNWAVGKGLINGKSETKLAPKDNATRAEIAAILQRFIEADK